MWLFGGAAYHVEEDAGAQRGGPNEQPLFHEPALIKCAESYSTWQY